MIFPNIQDLCTKPSPSPFRREGSKLLPLRGRLGGGILRKSKPLRLSLAQERCIIAGICCFWPPATCRLQSIFTRRFCLWEYSGETRAATFPSSA
jgi:hypothetical protein